MKKTDDEIKTRVPESTERTGSNVESTRRTDSIEDLR